MLPPALDRVAQLHPGAQVVVRGMDPLLALEELVDGHLDTAIVFEYDHVPLPPADRFELELLLEEELQVVLPRDHPSAGRRSVPLAELAGETWIKPTPRSSCREFTARACRAAGFEPRIGFEFDDYQAMQELVAAGAGVAFAPEMALGTLHPQVVACPLAFRPPHRRIHVATLPGRRSPVLETFLGALVEGCAEEASPVAARAGAGARAPAEAVLREI